jgi:hypothetical protein
MAFWGYMAGRRGSLKGSLLAGIVKTKDQETHSSIDNPYGFPLPEAGVVILEDEVVKEGHLVKSLKRRLFTLLIDPENFPCLIYSYVPSRALHSEFLISRFFSDPKSKGDADKADDASHEKGHVRLVRCMLRCSMPFAQ